jgi:hypothetical protein
VIGWANLNPLEREALMALAALHKEFGGQAAFESDAVALVAGKPIVAELGFLAMYGLAEFVPDSAGVRGFRLTGEGFGALPASMERLALAEHPRGSWIRNYGRNNDVPAGRFDGRDCAWLSTVNAPVQRWPVPVESPVEGRSYVLSVR